MRALPDGGFDDVTARGAHTRASPTLEQQPRDRDVIAEHCIKERGFAVAGVRVNVHATIEQVPRDFELAISGSIPKRHFTSRAIGRLDELAHYVESSDAGSPDHADTSTSCGEVLAGLRAPVRETRVDRVDVVDRETRMLDLRAVIQQDVDDGDLDAGFAWRSARRDETERGAAAAIDIRLGFDIRACREQQLGDPGRVRGRLL